LPVIIGIENKHQKKLCDGLKDVKADKEEFI